MTKIVDSVSLKRDENQVKQGKNPLQRKFNMYLEHIGHDNESLYRSSTLTKLMLKEPSHF